jgi:hypothetical protein
MSGRIIAIGDIHGCSKALAALLAEIRPRRAQTASGRTSWGNVMLESPTACRNPRHSLPEVRPDHPGRDVAANHYETVAYGKSEE